jgi:geranylgeranyl diphosphate synthase, type II
MKEKIDLIVKRLKALIPQKNVHHKKLFEAANYSLQSGGKKLRPLLVLLTVEALKKDYKIALDPACSLELIHTYSLIHDDLPSMDNDDMRRGKPSLHKAYPEWLAILTGDYLLTLAFDVIANAKKIDDKQKVDLIKTLSKYAGEKGLIAGQVADLSWENKNINLEKLKFMHFNKTASLFIASVEFGCIIAKASTKIKIKFLEFAKNFGIAFQIFNDIAGFHEKSSDITKKKSTAVSILGLSKAKKLGITFQKKALNILTILPYDTCALKDITKEISC